MGDDYNKEEMDEWIATKMATKKDWYRAMIVLIVVIVFSFIVIYKFVV